jgi:hypothetical protein
MMGQNGVLDVSWESNEPKAMTAVDEPMSRRTPAPPSTASHFGGADLNGTGGAVILAAFVLVLISGVLGLVNGIQRVDDNVRGDNDLEAAVVIIAGVASVVSAVLIWQGRMDFGGIIAIISGVVFLVLGPETAGLLGVLGGILALVARRVPEASV